MGTFKITVWNHSEKLCSKRVQFDVKDEVDIYARGLFEGLTISGMKPTGYTLSEEGEYVAIAITEDGTWSLLSTPTTKEVAEGFANSEKKNELFTVKTIQEVKDYPRVVGREYLD